MEPKPERRKQLRTLTCPECQQRGLFRTILWGMPDSESFDFEKYAVGGCCPRLLGLQIVDARGAALMVIEMLLVVKVWDTNIKRRVVTAVVSSINALLLNLNFLITKVEEVYEMSAIPEMSALVRVEQTMVAA